MMKGVSIASDQLSAVLPLQIAIYCIFQLYCRFKNMKILKFQAFYLENGNQMCIAHSLRIYEIFTLVGLSF